MANGHQNYTHAALRSVICRDPDCEIHRPEVIEDQAERLTALAWFYAGAEALAVLILNEDDRPIAYHLAKLREEHEFPRDLTIRED